MEQAAHHVRPASEVTMLIAQLSDPHIDLERPHKADAFGQAVEWLLALPMRPDAVLISGDCTEHGHPGEYARFQALLRPLPMPVYVVPGNHDDRAAMQKLFGVQGGSPLPGFMQYVVDDLPVRLIGLDTHVPGQGSGELDEARLDWLGARLSEAPERPTLIFMHHPPLKTGVQVMDALGLRGTEPLCDLLLRHPQVARIVAGHVHMALTQTFAGTTLMTCPGTDATLQPDLTQPGKMIVQYQPPLCLLHTWSEATGLLSFSSLIAPTSWTVLHDGQGWVG